MDVWLLMDANYKLVVAQLTFTLPLHLTATKINMLTGLELTTNVVSTKWGFL